MIGQNNNRFYKEKEKGRSKQQQQHMRHVYREANGCADALAKRGTSQRTIETIYEHCPTFVDVLYIRDLVALGETRLCIPGVATNVI